MYSRTTLSARALVFGFVGFTLAAALVVLGAWAVNAKIYPFLGRASAPSIFLVIVLSVWLVCGIGAIWMLNRNRADPALK